MHPLTSDIDALVLALVASDWPTSEPERRAWAAGLGLPVDGQSAPELDVRMPATATFRADFRGWLVLWRFFRDEFVGIDWFVPAGPELETVAAELRALWTARWDLHASDDPIRDYAYTVTDGREIQCYFHRPFRPEPQLPMVPGGLQLCVDHAQRAAAQEADARRRAVERAAAQEADAPRRAVDEGRSPRARD